METGYIKKNSITREISLDLTNEVFVLIFKNKV